MKLSNNLLISESGDKKNIPIIFVHGFPLDRHMWENQIRHLENSYYCLSFNLQGLGESDPGDGQYTIDSFADDIFRITDEMNLDKPVLCGLSMGGYIALRAAERDQQRFRGLILCDTKSGADNNEAKLKRAAGVKKINVEGSEKFISEFVPPLFAPESRKDDNEAYTSVMARSLKSHPIGLKGCLLAMAGRTDTTEFLQNINIPVLLLCGAFDTLTTPPVMREMHEKIKDSEFSVAPRAGHMSPVENPEFVNDVIAGFLKRRIQ